MTARPLLLIDVDGVLNPYAAKEMPPGFVRHAFDVEDGRTVRPLLNPEHGAWLRELAADFDLVWMTQWADQANEFVAPVLGLPPLPVIKPIVRGLLNPSINKEYPAKAFVKGRPFAWVEDGHGYLVRRWAQNRPRSRPALLIDTNPAVGLTRDHIEQLRRFAADLREGAAS